MHFRTFCASPHDVGAETNKTCLSARQALLTMKFIIVFLFIASMQVGATGYSQVTISARDIPIRTVFKQIQKQTGYDFLYRVKLLEQAGNVSIELQNVSLEMALHECLKDKPLSYQVYEKTVVIKAKEQAADLRLPLVADAVAVQPPVEVTGRVLNEKGEPMDGVTVSVKGTAVAVSTNNRGEFRISVPDLNATLILTAVTIETVEFKLNGRATLTVTVKEKITSGDEVLVTSYNTGYQSVSRERSAGAFASPNKVIVQDRSSSASVLPRLEGLIPGFAINFNTGSTPTGNNRLSTGEGNSNQYIIRGIGSIQSERAPLYVVNGIIQDDISSLNANDVEDITVLRDATAASIWGARAANGVIIITTKRGAKNEKIKVQYDAFYNMQGKPDYNYFPRMSSAEFITTAREVFDPVAFPWNTVSTFTNATSGAGIPPHEVILYNQSRGLITAAQANAQLDSLSALSNNQQIGDLFFRNQSLINQTISIRGGGNIHTFYGSFSYTNNQSFIPGEKNEQFTVNLRQDFNMNNRVKLFVITDLANNVSSNKRAVVVDNRFLPYQLFEDNAGNRPDMSYLSFITNDSVRNAFETRSRLNLKYNPLDEFDRGSTSNNGILARVTSGLTVRFSKGLRFEGTYGYARGGNTTTEYDAQNSFPVRSTLVQFTQAPVAPSTIPTYFLPTTGGQFSKTDVLQRRWTVRNQLVFDTSLAKGKHQITLLAGQEAQENFSNNTNSVVRGYNPLLLTFQNVDYNSLATTGVSNPVAPRNTGNRSLLTNPVFSESELLTRVRSYYANAGYTFLRRYTLNGSLRNDESNLFGINRSAQRRPVWSIGGRWLISGEQMLQKAGWINTLALRTTYGITGNAPSPGSATTSDVLVAAISNFAPGPGLNISTFANRALTWERTENINIGVDFAFFKRKLYGSLDLYERFTSDLIGQLPVNFIAGASNIIGNFGDMKNRGVELSLTSVNISGRKLQWQSTLNIGYNRNRIIRLQQITAVDNLSRLVQQTKYLEGYPALSIFAYNWAGLDNLGDPQIFLSDGSLYKAAATTNLSIDAGRFMGTFQPLWNGALLNFVSYKQFSLSSSIIFNLGHFGRVDVMQNANGRTNVNRVDFTQGSYPRLITGNLHRDLVRRWRQPGDEAFTDVPSYITTNTNRRNTAYYYFGSNNVYNASFAKLRDLTLSYGIPQSVLKRLKTDEIRFRVQVANVMLWRANKLGLDPEFQTTDINFTNERRMRVGQGALTFGVNIKF
ncbi:MAG TPA: SusC/RagA family TonB-linked outer membrane protein [Lacibacter sp.]|nr:SusC/RagA family TonB-linked outer membrane protein [Lacibacter sp.]HMO88034.1 SusC/RagA family TonB-linked outer membrane protein [Lacibacter sp.]HMP85904.1 SusC/RagA family TonB-linked outer membrane protein [Lacibacter sp.]